MINHDRYQMAENPNSIKIAIVHDWLIGGGAERVVAQLHRMFPDAPIYTSYCTNEWRQRLDNKVVTGFLQHWPFSRLRKFIGVLRMWWFSHLDLSEYDLVISSTGNGEAFGVRTLPDTTHICYCHSPTHYYWRHYDTYMKRPGFGALNPLVRLGLKLLVGPLRRWDYRAAQQPDFFIANSTHIQSDIKKYYGRDSVVIHPPINVERFQAAPQPAARSGFVTMGRQAPAKYTDIIIEACNKLQLPLTVIGNGPDHDRLVRLAGPTITFRTDVTDDQMPAELAKAHAFLFASFDDFGIAPIEAMAAGTPVIAFKAGGALDYVVEGKTGLFFTEQTAESLATVLKNFDTARFDSQAIQQHARHFSPQVFQKKLTAFIKEV
ncbi:MAG TPA: glycosyltransferase [Candidatus Saccharimonadales bacterium]